MASRPSVVPAAPRKGDTLVSRTEPMRPPAATQPGPPAPQAVPATLAVGPGSAQAQGPAPPAGSTLRLATPPPSPAMSRPPPPPVGAALRASHPSLPDASPASARAAQRPPPYVSIRRPPAEAEDFTPTIPRDAVADIEDQASKAGPPPSLDEDEVDDGGWDVTPEPLVPNVPVVLAGPPRAAVAHAGADPRVPASPPATFPREPSNLPPVPQAAAVTEDLSARHLLAEVDDALPTPAVNGLPPGIVDDVPVASGSGSGFGEMTSAAPLMLYGLTPPPPLPPAPMQAAAPSVPTAAPMTVGVLPPPPPPRPLAISSSALTNTPSEPIAPSTATPTPFAAVSPVPPPAASSTDIGAHPVVPHPPAGQKTIRIVRTENAPRLVPEVMTPALLSAGPYRGELHLESSGSGPALPAVAVNAWDAYDSRAGKLLRDAHPTVMGQHRLQEAARQANDGPPKPLYRSPVVLAALLGSTLGVVTLGILGLGIGERPPAVAYARAGSMAPARSMLIALRELEQASGAAPGLSADAPPAASPAASGPPPRRAAAPRSVGSPAEARGARQSSPVATPAKGIRDGF